MLLPIRLYPAKYHFMPTQGQIQEVELFFVAHPAKTQILLFLCEILFEITLELMVQKKLGRKFMRPIVEVEVWRKRVNMVDKWDQMGQDMPKYI